MEKLHGILIVVGWMFVLPVSTFIIRYFKNACVEKYIGNFSVWFAVIDALSNPTSNQTLTPAFLSIGPHNSEWGSGGTNRGSRDPNFCVKKKETKWS